MFEQKGWFWLALCPEPLSFSLKTLSLSLNSLVLSFSHSILDCVCVRVLHVSGWVQMNTPQAFFLMTLLPPLPPSHSLEALFPDFDLSQFSLFVWQYVWKLIWVGCG